MELDLNTMKYIMYVAGVVISLLISIVAFFLRKQIQVSETLTEAINKLTNAVLVIETQNKENIPIIKKRLDQHSAQLKKHSEKIAVLETKTNLK